MSLPLSPAEIDFKCEQAYLISLGLPAHNSDLYYLLLKGGFRYIELYEISRWTSYNDELYQIVTAKGGNNRYLEKSQVPEFYKAQINHGTLFFDWCRYATFCRTFRRTFVDYPIYLVDKNVTTHIFRYNICKKMYSAGSTIPEISVFLGEVDDQNTLIYVNSELFTNT